MNDSVVVIPNIKHRLKTLEEIKEEKALEIADEIVKFLVAYGYSAKEPRSGKEYSREWLRDIISVEITKRI